jgi:hypothetical protein
MKAVLCLLLLTAAPALAEESADRDAIRRVIAAFNDLQQRPSMLAPDADIAPLSRLALREASQVYFTAISIKFLTLDIAFVDAAAAQFGTLIMKRTWPAYFVLRRIGNEWRVSVLRITPLPPYPLGAARV